MARKKSFNVSKKSIGIALLIALVLMYIPLPLIDGKTIAAIIVLLVSLYELFM